MYEELQYEFDLFLKDVSKSDFCLGEYMSEFDYEDNFSHNEIEEAQCILVGKIKDYLMEHFPGKYVVTGGYCVFVLTIEEAQKRSLMNYEKKIVR